MGLNSLEFVWTCSYILHLLQVGEKKYRKKFITSFSRIIRKLFNFKQTPASHRALENMCDFKRKTKEEIKGIETVIFISFFSQEGRNYLILKISYRIFQLYVQKKLIFWTVSYGVKWKKMQLFIFTRVFHAHLRCWICDIISGFHRNRIL
jgi:hypothetical protein